jgi:hypothetical protein
MAGMAGYQAGRTPHGFGHGGSAVVLGGPAVHRGDLRAEFGRPFDPHLIGIPAQPPRDLVEAIDAEPHA